MAYNKKAIFASCLALGILVLSLAKDIYAQACYENVPKGPVVIYEDLIIPGWTNTGSWNYSVTQQTNPGGQDGSYALQAIITANWGAVEFYRDNTKTTFLDSLIFKIRRADSNGSLYVTAQKMDGSLGTWVPLSSLSTGVWSSVNVTLASMGLSPGDSIKGILFEGSAPTTFYLDSLGIVTALLQFPLSGNTPYTAQISAILDHSVPTGYYSPNANGVIKAYDGFTVGPSNSVCFNSPNCTIMGYKQDSSGTPFTSQMPLLGGYNDFNSIQPSLRNILWYDGHSGYDYPADLGINIHAATEGALCAATNRLSPNGIDPWRNTTYCPYGTDSINGPSGGNSWDKWNLFYIVYPNQYGGITYSTWYMHANNLEAGVLTNLRNNGYANVSQNTVVAYVGHTGLSSGDHLHFEVRENGIKIIDPYGEGSPGNFTVLWKIRP